MISSPPVVYIATVCICGLKERGEGKVIALLECFGIFFAGGVVVGALALTGE